MARVNEIRATFTRDLAAERETHGASYALKISAVLTDGRMIETPIQRGFTVWGGRPATPAASREGLTLEMLEGGVRNTMLPWGSGEELAAHDELLEELVRQVPDLEADSVRDAPLVVVPGGDVLPST